MHGIICIETEWQVTKKKNRLTLKEHRGQVSVPKGLHGVAEAATSFLRDNILTLCPVSRHFYFISFAKNPSMVPFSDEKLMPMAKIFRLSAA